MSSLAHYYSKAKGGLMNINPEQAVQHGENLMIAAGTGLALGLVSASIGGLDHDVAGMPVPVDGLATLALSAVGLSIRSPELLTASIATMGSASTRAGEKFFKKALGAHGDFDSNDLQLGMGWGQEPQAMPANASEYGWGWGSDDRLSQAAHRL